MIGRMLLLATVGSSALGLAALASSEASARADFGVATRVGPGFAAAMEKGPSKVHLNTGDRRTGREPLHSHRCPLR
jgi:hypothetical protein